VQKRHQGGVSATLADQVHGAGERVAFADQNPDGPLPGAVFGTVEAVFLRIPIARRCAGFLVFSAG
jgi:hypothetical protein